jgi:hypothetical protein
VSDDEPEVQHLSGCEHPVAPCTCPRGHLLNEARRIREMCLFAEGEFARENRRAVDLKIERDRLRQHTDALDEVIGGLHNDLHTVTTERDRLRAIVDGLRGYLSMGVYDSPEVTAVLDDLRAILIEAGEDT